MMNNQRNSEGLFVGLSIFLIVTLGSILYYNTLNVPFYFDDLSNLKNPSLKVEKLTIDEITESISGATLKSRPVSNLSFALNYYVGGYRVQGYHLVNITIHILSAIFLFLLIRLMINHEPNRRYYPNRNSIALFSVLIWLAHPLATQSVTYIVQRMNSMAAMFYILTLLLFVIGRNIVEKGEYSQKRISVVLVFLCAFISGVCAVGSKEIGATLPISLFLYEWFFYRDLSLVWLRKRFALVLFVGCVLFLITYLYTDGNLIRRIFHSYGRRDFTLGERLLTQPRVILHYISLLFFPHPGRLVLDYDFQTSVSILKPITTLISHLVLTGVGLFTVIISKKYRLIGFSILWFAINLIIESSVVGLEMVFEHRTYLPSMFLIIALVSTFHVIKINKMVLQGFFIGIILVLSFWTIERNSVWIDPVGFWRDAVTKAPEKARPRSNLGNALAKEKDNLTLAKKQLLIAVQLDNKAHIAHDNLAKIFHMLGENDKAEFHFKEAINIIPYFSNARMGYGNLLMDEKRWSEANEQFLNILERMPTDPVTNELAGRTALRSGDYQKSLIYLEKAHKKRPKNTDVLTDLGTAYLMLNDQKAITNFKKALKIDGSILEANYHLGMLYAQLGMRDEAIKYYGKASALYEAVPPILYNYANIQLKSNNLQEAKAMYEQYLDNSNTIANAYNNLGLTYVQLGEVESASENFKKAMVINAKHSKATANYLLTLEMLNKGEKHID